jgi:hypothetical protein
MIDTARLLEVAPGQPRVGDRVGARRDVLAEVARGARGAPRTWQLVPAGAVGKLVGWHGGEVAAVAFDDVVVLLRVASVTRL